jgi:aminopeptidase N
MFDSALKSKTFLKGLNYYLTEMEYQAAEPKDLYERLQKALNEDQKNNGLDVNVIMSSWEHSPGYPVITVSRNKQTLTIKQERFLLKSDKNPEGSKWWIPVNFVVASDPNFAKTEPDFWMKAQSEMVITNFTANKKWNDDDWMIFNTKQTGYYRVNYDENLWNLLIKELNDGDFNKIDVINRAQLIDDSLNLARAEKISYSIPFEILKYLKKDENYAPWNAADRGFSLIDRMISDTEYYKHFLNFVQENVNLTFAQKGVSVKDEDTHFDRHVRSIAINWACKTGIQKCLDDTSGLLDKLLKDKKEIHPDLQSPVYCNGLRESTKEVYDYFLDRFEKSQSDAERSLLITSLGCSQDKVYLYSYLRKTLAGVYRTHELHSILASVASGGPVGLELTLDFLGKNAKEIKEKYGMKFGFYTIF